MRGGEVYSSYVKAISIGVLALLTIFALPVTAAPAVSDVASVHFFSTGAVVPGSSAMLIRTAGGVSMTLNTSQLPAGDAVTIWWVIFNHPEFCSHGMFGLRCGQGDFSNPSVQASALFATGNVISADGTGNFGAHLNVGDTSVPECPTGGVCFLFGPGLTNPFGADIHNIVHDHGPVDLALMPGEIHSFNICNPTCADLQFAAHEA